MMKCYLCGGEMVEQRGERLEMEMFDTGVYSVDGVDFEQCTKCGETLLPPDTCDTLDKEHKRLIDSMVRQFPLSEFVTAAETAKMLGLTPAELRTHPRIRRGFVYHVRLGREVLYLKPSLLLYGVCGDGRFFLKMKGKDGGLVRTCDGKDKCSS
jgi:YgiT-type zinc finger domain-containing protein